MTARDNRNGKVFAMRNRLLTTVALAAALALSSPAFAQVYYGPSSQGKRTKEAEAAAAAAPKPTYDPHDISGVWWGRGNSFFMGKPVGRYDAPTILPPPLTAWGEEQFKAHKPSSGPHAVEPALGNDPLGHCDPLGYPRNLWANDRPFEMIQTPGKIVQLFEWGHTSREIWTDGRKLPEDPDPRWYGWAVGHWEGDTLVVDSTGYDERTWLDNLGYPHSEGMHLQERFHHPDAMTLEITMTLDDPKAYTKPWAGGKEMYHLQLPKGLTVLEEAYCVPSEEESFNQGVRDPAGKGISSK
jgi:hypothetical protein